MNPLRAVIVDDEGPARRLLLRRLLAHPEIAVVGEAINVREAAILCKLQQPDVVFLDIGMPGKNGFELLPALPTTTAVVFVTADPTCAVNAFAIGACDYLLKPFTAERLAQTVTRLLARRPKIKTARSPALTPPDTIVLTLDGALTRVTATDIVLVESDGAYSKVTLAIGQTCLVHKGIDQWEQLLPKPDFVRIDRFHIFQLASVTGVARESRDRSEVHLKGRAEPLALARVASVRLRTLIKASG